jgi:hypothetical protein
MQDELLKVCRMLSCKKIGNQKIRPEFQDGFFDLTAALWLMPLIRWERDSANCYK